MSSSNGRPHFTPWDDRAVPRAISPDEAARRAGIFAQVEERLADLLEQWSGKLDGDAATVMRRQARQHRWHAELFRNDLTDKASDAALPGGVARFLDAVADVSGPDQAIELLTGVYRVLVPRKVAAYTYFREALGSDAAETDARWLGFIMSDELDSIRDGELLLQTRLTGDDEVQRSADRRAALEKIMVDAGGLVGPGTLGAAQPQEVTTR